ncbi:MAG: hypothetical protein HQ534_14095 [Armatimonadetes bacterium]|nr:hypothetical protein [Armatimonadota bacterium]
MKNQTSNEELINKDKKILIPQICLFNFSKEDSDILKSKNFNISVGSLGKQIKIPNNKPYDETLCLPHHIIPPNLHEFNILCFDMNDDEIVPYDKKKSIREYEKNRTGLYFFTEFPQKIFDPRPFIASDIQKKISEFLSKQSIIIIFASKSETFDYQFADMQSSGYYKNNPIMRHSNYDFINNMPILNNKFGKKIEIIIKHQELKNIFNKFLSDFVYKIIFEYPTHWNGEKHVKKENFYPLMKNNNNNNNNNDNDDNDEVISYIEKYKNSMLIVLPEIKRKGELLVDLFSNALPSLMPELFPYSTKFAWKKEEQYWLPNYAKLFSEKETIKSTYENELKKLEKQTSSNQQKFQYLHDLISETGEKLVDAVKMFLEWLDFDEVIKVDEEKGNIKEEDLRINLTDGIIVIEVKGIGGTSKDNECNQIEKIVHRREKERNKFDVKGLYIVNHQRYLPPLKRKNPPFKDEQIKDAENDKRGLLTTWELFKLFDYETNDLITKENARKHLLNSGLIQFTPSNMKYINKVIKVYHNGKVIIIDTKVQISKNDVLIVYKNDKYSKVNILNLQIDGKDVSQADKCEIGIEVDKAIKINSEIYLKE